MFGGCPEWELVGSETVMHVPQLCQVGGSHGDVSVAVQKKGLAGLEHTGGFKPNCQEKKSHREVSCVH